MAMQLKVEGMSCAHCVREITGDLRSNDPTEHITDWREARPDELLRYARELTSMDREWSNWGLFRAAALEALATYCNGSAT